MLSRSTASEIISMSLGSPNTVVFADLKYLGVADSVAVAIGDIYVIGGIGLPIKSSSDAFWARHGGVVINEEMFKLILGNDE